MLSVERKGGRVLGWWVAAGVRHGAHRLDGLFITLSLREVVLQQSATVQLGAEALAWWRAD